MSNAARNQSGAEEIEPEPGTAIGNFFRKDLVGGLMLILAAALALVLANSPVADAFTWLRDFEVGPHALHLHLSLAEWAKDGLLALFFFVVGLELKRELVTGELAHWKSASLPIIAAAGGMILPAIIAYSIGHTEPHAGSAWAIPMATDIAFAVGVLSLFGSWMPLAGRVFLLSLAVVDDLGAIAMIVVLFTDGLNLIALGTAVLLAVAYWYMQRRRVTASWLYIPLGIALWIAVHTTGVHATIAGVVLGLLTRVKRVEHETSSPEERLEHRLSPWSAGAVVPIFAFFAAGVPVNGEALRAIVHDPVAIGVIVGLVVGKLAGVAGVSWLAIKVGLAHKPRGVTWPDMVGLSMLAGIGFTVSLLIAELSLTGAAAERAKAAVLIASAIATVLAGVTLSLRGRLARNQRASEAGAAPEAAAPEAAVPEAAAPDAVAEPGGGAPADPNAEPDPAANPGTAPESSTPAESSTAPEPEKAPNPGKTRNPGKAPEPGRTGAGAEQDAGHDTGRATGQE